MKDSGQENAQVSKLDISGGGNNQKMLTNRTCTSSAVMKCRSCAEVFYAKHYESHWCFRGEIDKFRESEVGKARSIDGEKNKGGKSLYKDKCSAYISDAVASSEDHPVKDYRSLELMLDIKPVVNKVWRFPKMLYKLFNKGAAASMECNMRDMASF